jgi:hypothetical protein
MADVMEINVLTGEVIERDYSEQELVQLEKDKIENKNISIELKKQYEDEVKKRNILVNKFSDLGFSDEEINKILPKIEPDYRILNLL